MDSGSRGKCCETLLWLAHNVNASLKLAPGKSKLKAVKGAYLRLLALLFYSILIMSLVKPNLISFGLGLLAGQIVIYLYEFISRLYEQGEHKGKNGKEKETDA